MNETDQEKWQKICLDTATRMIEHIKLYLSPISSVLSEKEGEHLGTGAYFELDGKNYLITNEHVARYIVNHSITHKFFEGDDILKLANPAFTISAPVDVAAIEIPDSSWRTDNHSALAIPVDRFASQHNPAIHELLFFAGYSSERSKFFFGHLFTPGIPYLTQECPFPTNVKEANPNFHFSLFYPPDLATSTDGTSHLPDPHGLSGSLVWDTKRVACLSEGIEWGPEIAQVTGIVCCWPSSAVCILATKVEHLELRKLISQEKKPPNDAN